MIRIVLCSPTPYRNQRVVRLMFHGQHVELKFCEQRVEQHKEKLGWNNTSVQPTTVAPLLSNNSWDEG